MKHSVKCSIMKCSSGEENWRRLPKLEGEVKVVMTTNLTMFYIYNIVLYMKEKAREVCIKMVLHL